MTTELQPRQRLQSLLDAVKRRWRAHTGLSALGQAAASASAPVFAAAALSALVPLSDRALFVLTVTTFLAMLAAAGMTALRAGAWDLVRKIPNRQIARYIEERTAALRFESTPSLTQHAVKTFDDELVSAVGESERPEHVEGFRALVIGSAARRLESIGPQRIVPSRVLRRAGFEALAGVGVFACAVALAAPPFSRALETAWVALFPGSLQMEVLPGDTRIASGRPLTIRARVRIGGKDLARLAPSLMVTDGRETRTVPMTPAGEAFEFSFESIDRTFRYRIAAGSSRSREYTVTALFPPKVQRIDLRYEYPAFTKLPAREEIDGGDIFAPEGTTVRVRVHTDKPARAGRLTLRGGAAAADGPGGEPLLAPTSDRVLEGTMVLSRDDSYRVVLTDADDLRSSGNTEYFIRVMEDRPPDVRIVRPEGDQQITPLEEVAIEARAEDDHGISRLELVYSVAGRAPTTVPLGAADGSGTVRAGKHVLPVEDLQVQPGDVISYYARARDISRGKRSTETRSDMFFLEIRPFSEEFVNAQSQGMAGATGDQIETLIAAQKEIISATWNIERRASAGAGRSASDITAIAQAQAELKGRVEQITGGARGRRGLLQFPQQIAPARQVRGARPGGDPVGAAVSAMGQAVEQLHGQRPADALSHEMAALQGLLQAQAEIRRREVAQTSASGGGMGRQGQDLSALFDKELQRQQRTNYETQSRVEPTPDRQDQSSALDAIRDLARRQEDLSRRQGELAKATLSADEIKRELEQLTREQNTLRAQADELARRLDQQGRQNRPGEQKAGEKSQETSRTGEGTGASAGTGAMRGASEQMRNAASDLQRQDPASAAERADRAASALRRLEQQMRGDGPEARERAAGELNLEARQIADEQRRIAGEASRLDKGAGDGDAWRRLAGDKDKLADRVEGLQRSTEQLAAGEKQARDAGRASRAAAAADSLRQEQIAGRMRETAKAMRDTSAAPQSGGRAGSSPPSRRAESEQQLARSLDRVVDRLSNGGTGADQLSAALDESRKLREGLDRLERQIRDAEAKQASELKASGRSAGTRGGTAPSGDGEAVRQLREQYAREVGRTRSTLSRLERSAPGAGLGGTTPETHEWSVTDQGTERFKQDYSQWEALKKDVELALERYEAAVVARAARQNLRERLSGGGSDRAPDAYRARIARYYESLARKK